MSTTVTEAMQQAAACHRAGNLQRAESLYRAVLQAQPGHPDASHNLGVLALQVGQARAALPPLRAAWQARPTQAPYFASLAQCAEALREAGCWQEAADAAQAMLQAAPEHAGLWALLAQALAPLHKQEEAAQAAQKAHDLAPQDPLALRILAVVRLRQQRVAEAAALAEQAVALDPAGPLTLSVLAAARLGQQRPDEAGVLLDRALAIQPLAEVHAARALWASQRRDLPRAIAEAEAALAKKDFLANVWQLLAALYRAAGRREDALRAWDRVLELEPDNAAVCATMAAALQAQGKVPQAFGLFKRAVLLHDSEENRRSFARCACRLAFQEDDPDARGLLVRALAQAWVRPDEMAMACATLVKAGPVASVLAALRQGAMAHQDLGVLAQDSLLAALLATVSVCDEQLERVLTAARALLLQHVAAGEQNPAADSPLLDFQALLAYQCFINEYVFDCSPQESALVEKLVARVASARDADRPTPAAWVAAIASYRPLGSMATLVSPEAGRWPAPMGALLRQQIEEPAWEHACQHHIARLTGVESEVSRAVQQQYEEHPYPRWIAAPRAEPAASLDAWLRLAMPRATLQPVEASGKAEILIAGCGTGRQAIQAAERFPQASVLAVDLSIASLAYAFRKTAEREQGAPLLEYAQADIMELASLTRRFHAIESVGVLHHLSQPLEGWRILAGLLRPRGVMRLGLYSELARREIVAARQLIARRGFDPSPEGIRACRAALRSAQGAGRLTQLLTVFRDFYSMSECRDLLFHVQEHRFTLPQLRQALQALGLRFLGFTGLDVLVTQAYARQHPDDLAMADLGHWHRFEEAHPDTFIGMYQFWVQKA